MRLQPYAHLIWDWNGTLLDDAWLCRDIMNGQLRRRELPELTTERYAEIFDFPVEKYYRAVGFDWSRESFQEAGTEFIVEYEKRKKECSLQPGAREFLAQIAAQGRSQAVLSAYSHATLEEFLADFEIRHHFRTVTGNRDHYAAGKVEQGLKMLEDLHVSPREALLIGDTTHDAEVAKAMGIDCVLIPCGHNSLVRLQACGVPIRKNLGEFHLE